MSKPEKAILPALAPPGSLPKAEEGTPCSAPLPPPPASEWMHGSRMHGSKMYDLLTAVNLVVQLRDRGHVQGEPQEGVPHPSQRGPQG